MTCCTYEPITCDANRNAPVRNLLVTRHKLIGKTVELRPEKLPSYAQTWKTAPGQTNSQRSNSDELSSIQRGNDNNNHNNLVIN